MRSRLVFDCPSLTKDRGLDDDMSDGELLARYLADGLPKHGFKAKRVVMEDWGWVVAIDHRPFSLWIGCGFSGESDSGLHCFIQPDKLRIWRWFRPVDARPTVERLGRAIEQLIRDRPDATGVAWLAIGSTYGA